MMRKNVTMIGIVINLRLYSDDSRRGSRSGSDRSGGMGELGREPEPLGDDGDPSGRWNVFFLVLGSIG